MAKILLVDDAAFMRMMIKNSLTKGGFADSTFVEAQDGMEAVKTSRCRIWTVCRL